MERQERCKGMEHLGEPGERGVVVQYLMSVKGPLDWVMVFETRRAMESGWFHSRR